MKKSRTLFPMSAVPLVTDHFPQFFILQNTLISHNESGSIKHDYSKYNDQKFLEEFDQLDFTYLEDSDNDVINKFERFLNDLTRLMTMSPLYPCGKPCSRGTHHETVNNLALFSSIINGIRKESRLRISIPWECFQLLRAKEYGLVGKETKWYMENWLRGQVLENSPVPS